MFKDEIEELTVTYTEPGYYGFQCTVNDTMGNSDVKTTESEVLKRMNYDYYKLHINNVFIQNACKPLHFEVMYLGILKKGF